MVDDFAVYEAVEDTFVSFGYWPGDAIVQDLVEACAEYVLNGGGNTIAKYLEDNNIDGTPALGIVIAVEEYAKVRHLGPPSQAIRRAIEAGCSIVEVDDYE